MNSFKKLKTKLAELFQLDQADLDFGIYRIMNARRNEITRFLESDLMPQVREAFGEYKSIDKADIQKELDKIVHGVKAAGMDPEQAPKVKELSKRLAEEGVDVTALENETYDHLFNFFSRYYDEGDFISLRRYKEGVYAIPYEGEEVKLYWANHDQYYIKTTEYFRDYSFKLKARYKGECDKSVHFKIAEADTEKDNIKAANGNDRRFLLHGDNPVAEENGELIIRFEYRVDGDKRKQDAINADTAERVIADLNDEKLAVWQHRLSAKWTRADGTASDKTILDKHLFDYTRRNTFDYFIHKDLGGFLRRELDFYIKNEVMRLDDIEEESAPRVEQYLSKIKVIRRIAHKIIDFLTQIENFQKKLWLKKKFVVETNYCVTIDRIISMSDEQLSMNLLKEIAANDAQREEWVKLFAIDEIKKDLAGASDYSEPLTVEFLKANPFLVLDTKFFSLEFKDRLLSSLDDVEGKCNGLLVHSENFQAMLLGYERYRSAVACSYNDPPYNTGDRDFPYKDSYQHSSWISMMNDRLRLVRNLLAERGSFVCHIDEHEFNALERLIAQHFGVRQNIGPVVWDKRNPKGDPRGIATQHEYLCWAVRDFSDLTGTKGNLQKKKQNAEAILSKAVVLVRKAGGRVTQGVRDGFRAWVKGQGFSGGEVAYCELDDNGEVYQSVSMAWPNKQKAPDEYFEPLMHPVTKKPCPLPARGWRNPPQTMKKLLAQRLVLFGSDESTQPRRKYLLKDNLLENIPSLYYFGGSDDALQVAMGYSFPNPKPVRLGKYVASIAAPDDSDVILDCFAGSGTTGHAVIDLHRDEGIARQYVLIEMGNYFDTVLLPRIQKAIYSKDWKDGKPVSREGISHMFKYIRLESYEDALANIKLQRGKPQQRVLFPEQESSINSVSSVAKQKSFRESYMLKYLLDVESRGSQTLLNIDNFDDPWNYKLLVGTGSVGETRPVNADLVETFNWLLGLKVKHIDRISLPAPESEATRQAGGFQVVEGENPSGEKVLVIWRKVRDLDETDIDKIATAREQTNRDLEAFFRKQQYNTLDSEFDVIYVNGDNNLMNVPVCVRSRTGRPLYPDKEGLPAEASAQAGVEPRYKVRLIEEEFKRLMFDVKDV